MSAPPPTPVGYLLGIVKTAAQQTAHALPPHLTPLAEGREVPAFENLELALKEAGQVLSDDQCACLFANIANVCVKDGELNDGGLLKQAAHLLRLENADANDVSEAVEIRFHAAKVFRSDKDWSLFCAGLFAMAEADEELVAAEQAYLRRFVPDLDHIAAGKKLCATEGANITEQLAGFNNRQKRCFAAHAIAIMFIDGLWKGTEQEFMDLAAKRLLIVQFDVARLLKGLFTLFNVSVFSAQSD